MTGVKDKDTQVDAMILPWVTQALKDEGLTPDFRGLFLYQSGRLQRVYSHAMGNSNFYQEFYRGIKLLSKDLPFQDQLRLLPITCSNHIVEKPYWFLGLSQTEVLRSYVVDVDEGKYKQIFYTKDELEHIINAIAMFFKTIGVKAGTEVAIVFPPENEWGIPDLISRAVVTNGGKPTLIEDEGLEEQIRHISAMGAGVVVGSAQQLFYMSALFPMDLGGYKPWAMVPCHGCVPYLFTDRAKGLVRRSWQASIYEHFGITEMGFNVAVGCDRGDWVHLNEADVYAEVIDPETEKPLPPGSKGELVLTNLASRAMPILRYRTGYIVTIMEPGCPCGDHLTRRLKIHSNIDTSNPFSQPLVFRPF